MVIFLGQDIIAVLFLKGDDMAGRYNTIKGTNGLDILYGTAGADRIYGYAGQDSLEGAAAPTVFTAAPATTRWKAMPAMIFCMATRAKTNSRAALAMTFFMREKTEGMATTS
nr:hypothetical protein [Rhizobium sp. G21]